MEEQAKASEQQCQGNDNIGCVWSNHEQDIKRAHSVSSSNSWTGEENKTKKIGEGVLLDKTPLRT